MADAPMTRRVRRHVAAPPEEVFALVSDVVRTAAYSDEVDRLAWLTRADSRTVTAGDTFEATNRRGDASWASRSTVVTADPGRRFSFVVGSRTQPTATWTYDLAPVDGGTELTYTVTRGAGPSMTARFLPGEDGEQRRLDLLADAMRRTLDMIAMQLSGS